MALNTQSVASPAQKVRARAIAGIASVISAALIVRSPRSVLPDAAAFSLLGARGQFAVNKWYAFEKSYVKTTGWLDMKWSPMRRLSDEEYANILREKVIRLKADIAIIDEN